MRILANFYRFYRQKRWRRSAFWWGRGGELVAMLTMLARGYLPLRWGWRGVMGTSTEIDWVLRRGTELLLLEVKTRRTQQALTLALGHAQKNRQTDVLTKLRARYPAHTLRWGIALVSPQWPWVRIKREDLTPAQD